MNDSMSTSQNSSMASSGEQAPTPVSASFVVDDAEAGQKLMNLLERRLSLPQPLLHRWIRTGQVRINGKRCQPFLRINAGDAVRLPPFAGSLSRQAQAATKSSQERETRQNQPRAPRMEARLGARPDSQSSLSSATKESEHLEIIAEDNDYYAVYKPAGLPVHPGTGHTDAVTVRLRAFAEKAAFTPTPVHRLDRDTTGVLLVAKTYTALQYAHDALRNEHALYKEYLVWVHGLWQKTGTVVLRHYLHKDEINGRERMVADTRPGHGQEAVLCARIIHHGQNASLLQVRILTGRTHQIRVQLASVGYPVIGDAKYGQKDTSRTLYLHAARLVLPDKRSFEALPRWSGPFAVEALPLPMEASLSPEH